MNQETSISRYASVLLLFVATFVIHGHVLERFWLDDDPQVLLHASRYGPVEIATDRMAWQELSASNFTPLVTWSFDLDLALFGLEPRAFYIHQLLAVAVAALTLRLMLIVWGVGSRASTLAALLFLIAPPTIHVAGHLMTRHYVEGLVLALLSMTFWGISENGEHRSYAWVTASAVAYLGAILAKEVYLPLPLALLALEIGRVPFRRVVACLAPHALALAGYVMWRRWILGGGGGYGEQNPIGHFIDVSAMWVDSNPTEAIWLGTLVAASVLGCFESARASARYLFIAIACVAPLVGVGDALEPRHLLVPAVAAVCGSLVAIGRSERAKLRSGGTWLIVLAGVIAAVPTWRGTIAEAGRMEAEGRYVWEEGRESLPLLATSHGWYLDGIAELDRLSRSESSPPVFYSKLGLVLGHDERFMAFDERGTPSVQSLEDTESRKLYEPGAAISLEIRRGGQTLHWSFGPVCDCTWTFYSYPYYQMFVVPASGSRVVPRPRGPQWFRIERREADGSWTMSPPLALPRDGEIVSWSRADDGRQSNQ